MALWNVDLTTEDGARGAAQLGAFACFVAAVLIALGLVFASVYLAAARVAAAPLAIGALSAGLAEIIVFLVAALRLYAGRGMVWGAIAALLLVVELIGKAVSGGGLVAIGVLLILLVVTINGVRAAHALRGLTTLGRGDVADVFE